MKYTQECTKFNGKRNKGGKLPQDCDRKERAQGMQGKRKMRADKKSTKHGRWMAAPGADVGIQSRRNERRKGGGIPPGTEHCCAFLGGTPLR